jgi:NAD(P)-dependent dehydrogenase (short-subunit alcohol dehydrogenase family)
MAQAEMRGKICLVTGANSGIGKVTAAGLAKMGATVVMACRDQARGEETLADIQASSGNDAVALMIADLSSQASIHQLAQAFRATYPDLHVLVNNAGIGPWRRAVSVDGIEMTFAVNCLAPFLLTHLLLDRLRASAHARIINVTSAMNTPLISRICSAQSASTRCRCTRNRSLPLSCLPMSWREDCRGAR